MSDDSNLKIGIEADYSQLTAAIDNAIASINNATKTMSSSMQQMSSNTDAAMIKATTATTAATEKISLSVRGMGVSINESMRSVNSAFAGLQGMLMKVSAIAAGGAIFGSAIGATTSYYKEIWQLSNSLGISSQKASGLNVALEQVGITTDEYLSASKAIAKQLESNGKGFEELGIKTTNANGTFRNTQDILMDTANVLKNTESGTSRNVAAVEIFKKAQIDIAKFSKLTGDELQAAAKKAEQLGLVLGPKQMANYGAYIQAQRDLKLVLESLSVEIGSAVLPALASFGKFIVSIPSMINGAIGSVNDWIDAHAALVSAVETAIEYIGVVIGVIGLYRLGVYATMAAQTAWTAVTVGTSAVMTAITTVTEIATAAVALFSNGCFLAAGAEAAMSAGLNILIGTVVVVGVAVAALATAWYTNFNGIKDATAGSINAIAQAFTALWEHLKNIGSGIFNVLKGALALDPATIQAGIDQTVSGWSGAMTDIGNIASNAWEGVKTGGILAFEGVASKAKSIMSSVTGGDNTGGGDTGAGNQLSPTDSKKEKDKGPSPYELAKSKYEAEAAKAESDAEISGQKYTNDQKLALYLKLLSDVQKKTEEQTDFTKGQYELQSAAFKENSDLRKATLELEIAQGKANTQEAYEKNITILKDISAHTLTGSVERIDAEKAVLDFEQQNITKMMALDKKKLDNDREIAEQGLAIKEENIKQQYALGQISQIDEIKQLNSLAATKRGLEEEDLQDQISMLDTIKGLYPEMNAFIVAQQEQLNAQLSSLRAKNSVDATKNANQLTTIMVKPWQDLKTQVQGVMSQNIAKVMEQTETVRSLFQNMTKSILDSIVQMFAKWASEAIMNEVTQIATGKAIKAAADGTTQSTLTGLESTMGILVLIAGILGSMGGGSGSTVTNVRSSNSYYSSKLPSYAVGTNNVTHDQVAQIHKGERIVPASQNNSESLGNMFGGGSDGASISHNPTYNISAMDGRSVERALANNSRQVTKGLQRVSRSLNTPNPSRWGIT